MFRTPLNLFRVLAVAEAVSWTLLIGGLILRATAGLDAAVSVGGGIHGFVFLSYAATAVLVAKNQRWTAVPLDPRDRERDHPLCHDPDGALAAPHRRLDGAWRLEPDRRSAGSGRGTTASCALLLRRPWVLAALLAAAVVAIFVVPLIVGPPGGRG